MVQRREYFNLEPRSDPVFVSRFLFWCSAFEMEVIKELTRLWGRVAGLGSGTHSVFLGQVGDDAGNSGISVSGKLGLVYESPADRNSCGSAGLLHCSRGECRRRSESNLVVRLFFYTRYEYNCISDDFVTS